jgi:hypothetical protein
MENPDNEDIIIQIEETLHLFLRPNNITTFFPFPAMFYLPCADHVLSCMIQVSRYLLYRVTGPLLPSFLYLPNYIQLTGVLQQHHNSEIIIRKKNSL